MRHQLRPLGCRPAEARSGRARSGPARRRRDYSVTTVVTSGNRPAVGNHVSAGQGLCSRRRRVRTPTRRIVGPEIRLSPPNTPRRVGEGDR